MSEFSRRRSKTICLPSEVMSKAGAQSGGAGSLDWVFRHEQRDPRTIVDVRNAGTLVDKWERVVERGPPIALALVDRARRSAPMLVVGDVHADRPVRRADEHVVFDRVFGPEVVGAM